MSPELLAVLEAAREHALASANKSGDFVPFIWYRDASGDHLIRAVVDTVPESVKALRRERAPKAASSAVIAYPGILTIQGQRIDAVILEGQDRSMDRPAMFGQPVGATSEPIFGGYVEQRLLV
jgi:hypothetical protein